MMTNRRGITLLELLVASLIGLVVILAFGQVDVTRVHMEQQIRKEALFKTEIISALSYTLKDLEQADRVRLISSDPLNIQVRIPQPSVDNPPACPAGSCPAGGVPAPCCFDIPANYRWVQYKLVGDTLFFYSGACTPTASFQDIGGQAGIPGFAMTYQDLAPDPPGGPPFPGGADNNLAEFVISSKETFYESGITVRAAAYTNVNSNCPVLPPTPSQPCDSGTGLAPAQSAFDPPFGPC